jgi:hypothetical protein
MAQVRSPASSLREAIMAHNTTRAERLQGLSVATLIALYKAKTLSSAAAAFELRRRGLALPQRE